MHQAKRSWGGMLLCCMAVWCLTTVCCLQSTGLAVTANTDTEQWVLEQVRAGRSVNLKEEYSDEVKRRLRASFLIELLTDDQQGEVQIAHAVLTEPVFLKGATIPHHIEFLDCQFEAEVDFSNSIFRHSVSFAGSTFKKNVLLHETIFEGEVQFTRVDIAGRLWASKARFSKIVDLHRLKVGEIGLFDEAMFLPTANFRDADFQQFEAENVQFRNADVSADFSGMQVRRRASLNQAEFQGIVLFAGAEFQQFEAEGIRSCIVADFSGMRVRGRVSLNQAEFHGIALFREVEFRQFEAKGIKFLDLHATDRPPVDWCDVSAQKRESRSEMQSQGLVDFRNAEIVQISFWKAQFQNQQGVFFNGLKVHGDALFIDTCFAGPVFFNGTDIAGRLHIANSQFYAANPSFNDMKVRESVHLSKVLFEQHVTFDRIEVREFEAERAHFLGSASNGSRWAAPLSE